MCVLLWYLLIAFRIVQKLSRHDQSESLFVFHVYDSRMSYQTGH